MRTGTHGEWALTTDVLGRLEVVRDGVPVELGAFRQRALLGAAAGQRRDGAVDRSDPRRAVGRGGRRRQAELAVGVRLGPARRAGARAGEALGGHGPADPGARLRAGRSTATTPTSVASSARWPRLGCWPRRPGRRRRSRSATGLAHVARSRLRGVRLRVVGAGGDHPARGAAPRGDRGPHRRRPPARAVPRAGLRAARPRPPAPAARAAS